MHNIGVKEKLKECWLELSQIRTFPKEDSVIIFLQAYAIIKVSGTVEFAYKNIIADYCKQTACQKTMKYIDKSIRNNSSNPTLDNMYKTLKQFDKEWLDNFKSYINNHREKEAIYDAFKSIVDMRNAFAHGGKCSATINDIFHYYKYMYLVIIRLDQIISKK